MASLAPLSTTSLLLSALLVVLVGALSILRGLGLERSLAVAAARMVAQLLLVGYLLKAVFALQSILWTALLAFGMVGAAAFEVGRRRNSAIGGPRAVLLGGLTLLATGVLTTVYLSAVILQNGDWAGPRVFLPLLGLLLGNALTAVALVLDAMTQAAQNERAGLEARLALGHGRQLAFRAIVRRSLASALLPTLHGMTVAGLVSPPGLMAGQILAGTDPLEAAKLQIAVMCGVAGSSCLAAVAAAYGAVHLLTDERSRLRLATISS